MGLRLCFWVGKPFAPFGGQFDFYHPDFGASVSSKATRFGMVIAFASIGMMIIAGWIARRKESEEEAQTAAEDILEETTPVIQVSVPTYNAPTYPVTSRPTYGASQSVDPLTLDPRARYKMLRSQGRYSTSAQGNLWGSGAGSAFGRTNGVADDNSTMIINFYDYRYSFFCRDCKKIVEGARKGSKYEYTCPDCKSERVAFGTEKAICDFSLSS